MPEDLLVHRRPSEATRGFVPARDEPKASCGVPEDPQVRQRPSIAREMVAQIFTSWNLIADWLRRINGLQQAA